MLTKSWTTRIAGDEVTFSPVGESFSYCGTQCQSISVSTRVDEDTSFRGANLVVGTRATRYDIERQLERLYD